MHKQAIVFLAGIVASACGGASSGQRCATSADDKRPVVELAWEVAHGSMDDDPPRPRVTLIVKGAKEERLVLGEMKGTCHLVELGVQPDQPSEGLGVSELACDTNDATLHARVVHEKLDEIFVRLWESKPGGGGMVNVRDVPPVPVPSCARFTSELQQPNDL